MTDHVFTASLAGTLVGEGLSVSCILGRGGVIEADLKREGDGASPLGKWPMRRVFYRADRLARPVTQLPVVPLREQDGWCDAPDHPLYNRPVSRPFSASHEQLWRDDHAYDVVVELGHNDDPVRAGLGSAIFLHLRHDDGRPTAGCVAIDLDAMLAVLRVAGPNAFVAITS